MGRRIFSPVYAGESLAVGTELRGPAVIEFDLHSVVLPSGVRAVTDKARNLVLEL
jgi:hypothetical protein